MKQILNWSAFLIRRHWIPLVTSLAVLLLCLVDWHQVKGAFNDDGAHGFRDLVRVSTDAHLRIRGASGDVESTYFAARTDACVPDHPCSLLAIADLDKQSRIEDGKRYKSLVAEGQVFVSEDGSWHVSWSEVPQEVYSPLNEGNRGMELSELILFDNRLYAVDDRTGIVFEILKTSDNAYDVQARHILTEGDGVSSSKGMKLEWGTVKDNSMWLGSFGKEYTLTDGSIKNYWPLWVATIDRDDTIQRKDWTPIYNMLRDLTGASAPGYMIHEAVEWSPYHRRWFILPRRWSPDPYVDDLDNMKGTNKLISCNESFLECTVTEIGHTSTIENPRRGYSSTKIIPGTRDGIFIALKSEEEDAIDNNGKMQTYTQIFDAEGNVLSDDTLLPFEGKFEGIVIVDHLR